MRVIFESPIAQHDATLYEAETVVPAIEGFAGVGPHELDAYEQNGYLAIRRGFNRQEVAAAVDELQAMCWSDNPRCESIHFESSIRAYLDGESADIMSHVPAEIRAPRVRKFMDFVDEHPALATLVNNPVMLGVIRQIIDGPVKCFQEMALVKPPCGQEKPWHQDHAYFNLPLSIKIVGVWIALVDVMPEMGCMHVVPGGHRGGPQPHFKRRDWQICDNDMKRCLRAAVAMQAGDVLLFDSKLPHGTPINQTEHQRFAVQFHFAPREAEFTRDEDRMAIFGNEGKNVRC